MIPFPNSLYLLLNFFIHSKYTMFAYSSCSYMYVACSIYWHILSPSGTLIDLQYCRVHTHMWRISHSFYPLSLFVSLYFIHYSRVHHYSLHSLFQYCPFFICSVFNHAYCSFVSPSSRYHSLSLYILFYLLLTSLLQHNLYVHYLANYLQYLLIDIITFLCRHSAS